MISLLLKAAGVRGGVYGGVKVEGAGRAAKVHVEVKDDDGDADPEVRLVVHLDGVQVFDDEVEVPASALAAPIVSAVLAAARSLPAALKDKIPSLPILPL